MPPAEAKVHLPGVDETRGAHAGHAPATRGAQAVGAGPPAQDFRAAPAAPARASAGAPATPVEQRVADALTLGIAPLRRSGTRDSEPIKAVGGGDPTAHSAAALRG